MGAEPADGGTAGNGAAIGCTGLAPLPAFHSGLKNRRNLSEVNFNNGINFYTPLVCSFMMKLNFL